MGILFLFNIMRRITDIICQIWSSKEVGLFLSCLLFSSVPSHATSITWEDRGGEAIRLGAVTATASTPSGTDNKDQGAYAQNDPSKRNYAYDPQGNLISDKSEGIATIEWTVAGKVCRITRTPQSGKPDLEFRYEALGNRVSKTVISKTDGNRTK